MNDTKKNNNAIKNIILNQVLQEKQKEHPDVNLIRKLQQLLDKNNK